MKYKFTNWKKPFCQVMVIGIIAAFSSCDSYNFSKPQPVGKTNIYEFPNELRGKWYVKDESDNQFYYFNKNYVLLVLSDNERIVNGAWPKLDATGKEIPVPAFYKSVETIIYDSLKKPADTVTNYLFNKGLIYEIADSKFLKKGYSFKMEKDTIVVAKNDTICIDLGQNAFLRQLNRNTYMLNIRNSVLGEDASDYSYWWRLVILERKSDNYYNLWECTPKTGELPCRFFAGNSKGNLYYFDCQWTSEEVLRMMNEEYFEVSSEIRKEKD